MLIQQTREHLYTLRLTGLLQALEEQLAQPAMADLGFEHRLALLVDREITERENRRLTERLRRARLRLNACAGRHRLPEPARPGQGAHPVAGGSCWVNDAHNLCHHRSDRCGKTWLACALGDKACREGHSAQYLRLSRLLREMRIANGDGCYPKLLASSATEMS